MDTPTSSQKIDVYQIVTDQVIQHLEKGTIPWRQPWTEAGAPQNLLSGRSYRGINLWLLLACSYPHNLFLTWDQIKGLGGSVKRGEHGHIVVFWKMVPKEGIRMVHEKEKYIPILRYYKVFNIDQCTDLPERLLSKESTALVADAGTETDLITYEHLYQNMPQCPEIKHKQQKAFYDPLNDYINMPRKKSFTTPGSYYATLFHELVHSTGHEKRLGRPSLTAMAEFGSEPYSIEELIAEMGAAYLCSFAGILPLQIENSAAYIGGWLQKLRNDKKFIISSSVYAQRAADYILNYKASEEIEKEVLEQPEVLE
jgi:antirestriction protein ArdC